MNFKLNKEQWQKIGKGMAVALLGATAVFLTTTFTTFSFGSATPFVVAAASVAANYIRKVLIPMHQDEEGDK